MSRAEYWACGASLRSASVALRGALLLVSACVHSAETSVLVRMDGMQLWNEGLNVCNTKLTDSCS